MDVAIQKRRYIVDNDIDIEINENANKIRRVRKSNGKTKVFDLNDDCLEKLFSYLRLRDLGNICMSSTRFPNSAEYVFRTLHADTLIVFDPCAANGRIYKDFLNMLDGFGDHVKRLQVTFYHEQRYRNRNQEILNRIVEKCSKSVIELNLSNVQNNMNISKPFLHLQKFTLNDSYFNDSMANFIRMSPKIMSLDFYSVENVFNSSFVEQKVPLMEHFGNYNQVITDSEVENLKKFRRFVNVNQQLTSLGVGEKELEMMFRYEEIRQQFFKTIHRKLPYPYQPDRITYLLPFEPVYFGQLHHLSLSLGYSTDFLHCMRERRLSIVNLPLQQLELYIGHFNIELVDFIVHCRHVRKLQLYVCERLNIMNVVGVAFNLPQLDELQVFLLYDESPKISIIPDVMNVIAKNCEHVKRIVVGFEIVKPSHSIDSDYAYEKGTANRYESIFYDSFSKNLPSQWSVHFKTQNIDIKRQNSNTSYVLCAVLDQRPRTG